jgi:hypothetical protein
MKNPSKKAPIPLELPTVPVAIDGGLLPIEYLTTPVKVSFPVWQAAEAGYTYQLVFDGNKVPPEKVILNADKPGDPLEVEVPVELLTEGAHRIAYRIFSPPRPHHLPGRYPEHPDLLRAGRPGQHASRQDRRLHRHGRG